jgi:hypothetical protein
VSDTNNDIEELFCLLDHVIGGKPHRAALTALVAERDRLKAQCDKRFDFETFANLVAERDGLKQRVAELEAHPPSDRDRELRERLVESALQGAARDAHMEHQAAEMGQLAVYMVDAAIAAMRKQGGGS